MLNCSQRNTDSWQFLRNLICDSHFTDLWWQVQYIELSGTLKLEDSLDIFHRIHDLFDKTFLLVFVLSWALDEVTKETPLAALKGGEHRISDLKIWASLGTYFASSRKYELTLAPNISHLIKLLYELTSAQKYLYSSKNLWASLRLRTYLTSSSSSSVELSSSLGFLHRSSLLIKRWLGDGAANTGTQKQNTLHLTSRKERTSTVVLSLPRLFG